MGKYGKRTQHSINAGTYGKGSSYTHRTELGKAIDVIALPFKIAALPFKYPKTAAGAAILGCVLYASHDHGNHNSQDTAPTGTPTSSSAPKSPSGNKPAATPKPNIAPTATNAALLPKVLSIARDIENGKKRTVLTYTRDKLPVNVVLLHGKQAEDRERALMAESPTLNAALGTCAPLTTVPEGEPSISSDIAANIVGAADNKPVDMEGGGKRYPAGELAYVQQMCGAAALGNIADHPSTDYPFPA